MEIDFAKLYNKAKAAILDRRVIICLILAGEVPDGVSISGVRPL